MSGNAKQNCNKKIIWRIRFYFSKLSFPKIFFFDLFKMIKHFCSIIFVVVLKSKIFANPNFCFLCLCVPERPPQSHHGRGHIPTTLSSISCYYLHKQRAQVPPFPLSIWQTAVSTQEIQYIRQRYLSSYRQYTRQERS